MISVVIPLNSTLYEIHMSITVSDFFEVILIGDVTVIKLLDAADYRRDRSKETDLAPLIHQMGGPPPPETLQIWERFQKDLIAYLDTNTPTKVVFDFAGLHQIGYQAVISSAMNGVYATAKKQAERFGCEWRICGLTKVVRSTYNISSLHNIFPQIHDAQSEAVSAFSTNVTNATKARPNSH